MEASSFSVKPVSASSAFKNTRLNTRIPSVPRKNKIAIKRYKINPKNNSLDLNFND